MSLLYVKDVLLLVSGKDATQKSSKPVSITGSVIHSKHVPFELRN